MNEVTVGSIRISEPNKDMVFLHIKDEDGEREVLTLLKSQLSDLEKAIHAVRGWEFEK